MSHNAKFSKQVIQKNDGSFHAIARIPMYLGWIEDVRIVFIDGCNFKLNYTCSDAEYAYFEGDFSLETTAICYYYFSFTANQKEYIACKNGTTDNILANTKSNCFKMSVNFHTPNWAKNAIIYHIFVDRFAKGQNDRLQEMSNRVIHSKWDEEPVIGPNPNGKWNVDFFGGNLKGIEEKLDYIKSLGATILYLSPIVLSQSNHRYDTGDYEQVDPYLGTNEDLKSLCDKAHEKGMYVILDAVFNHTGNDSKYFNEYGTYDTLGAFQSKNSPYYPYYKKTANGEFEYWWGMHNLPVCDGNSKEWKKYILGETGIINQWFKLGIDGLRLDVADELTDEFIAEIRKSAHRNKPDALIIGEVWENPMRMNRGYLSSGLGMDTVMNYQLTDALVRYYKYNDVYKLQKVINVIDAEYPEETMQCLMNFTSTHDISRIINILGSNCFNQYAKWGWDLIDSSNEFLKNRKISEEEYSKGKEILKSYLCALAFMPGMLSIFYGDEVGVEGYGNLLNRKTYPWEKQDRELLRTFKEIGNLKKQNDFLKRADLKIVELDMTKIMYERYDENESILVITSRLDKEIAISLPEQYRDYKVIFKLENCDKEHLAPYGAIVLKK